MVGSQTIPSAVNGIEVIAVYRGMNTYALNVVLGALQQQHPDIPVTLARDVDDAIVHISRACTRRRRILVIWSFYSSHFIRVVRDLSRIREARPDPRIFHLAGGVHATAEPEQTLSAGFDGVAVGEGEHLIGDLIRGWSLGEDRTEVDGLYAGSSHVNRKARPVENLDMFPPFAPKLPRVNPIEITRGCIYACSFCQTPFLFKARFRHRSVGNIVRHVEFMLSHGIRDIRFITPTSLSYGSSDSSVNLDAVGQLLSAVRKVIGTNGRLFFGTFPSEVRPEHVTPASVALLKRYIDNTNLVIGGQSGSDAVLRRTHRGHTADVIESAVRHTKEAGLTPNVDFIFGLPGETDDDVAATIRLAEKITAMGARIHAHTFMPLPGTPLRRARPGVMPKPLQTVVHKLVARGKLYGQWQRQAGYESPVSSQ